MDFVPQKEAHPKENRQAYSPLALSSQHQTYDREPSYPFACKGLQTQNEQQAKHRSLSGPGSVEKSHVLASTCQKPSKTA